MTGSGKIRVAVLYGGRSAEHEVSLQSAKNVIQYLDKDKFEVIPLGIDKQGNWFLGDEVFKKSLEHKKIPLLPESVQTWFTPEWVGVQNPIVPTQSVDFSKGGQYFDVIFPAVHGQLCEDGTLQGLLELAGIAYVGSNVLSSAVGMDKDVSKRLVQAAGINVPPFIVLRHQDWYGHEENITQVVDEKIAFPVFVKPANTGSSIGITKVKSADKLAAGIEEAFRYDTKVIIEKGLDIIELEVAVLQSLKPEENPIVSVVGEIRPNNGHEFYSYDSKYQDEADLLIPASISGDVALHAQELAMKIFQILDCEGMARVDLFLNKTDHQIYFNEVNTLPGFTKISMYPKLMGASGISYSDLLTHLIQLALQRHKNKSRLVRSYAD